jgi:hypothetical protein
LNSDFNINFLDSLNIEFYPFDFSNVDSAIWKFGDGTVLVINNPTNVVSHTYSSWDDFLVCQKVFGSCPSETCKMITSSAPQLKVGKITANPNPVNSVLKLANLPPNEVFLKITNVLGLEMEPSKIVKNTDGKSQVDFQHLPPGVYFLHFQWHDTIQNLRVIKE